MPTATTTNCSPPTAAPSPTATPAARRQPTFLVTTSWDDGNPSDFRLAELLSRYDLPATFYVPRASQRPTLSAADVRQLSTTFELGGHTLDHLPLTDLSPSEARHQIEGCKAWLEDVTGRECPSFCPPLGRFRREHLNMIRSAGFYSARTVELLSIDPPRTSHDGPTILPTTVQAYPHARTVYARNALRRRSPTNLWHTFTAARSADWVATLRSLLGRAARVGGVIHLWGHSWEIDETNQWPQLEDALRLLRDHSDATTRVTNGQLTSIAADGTATDGARLSGRIPHPA